MNNEGLKLIAIKPLFFCSPKLLKVLNPGEVYYLANRYKILPYGREQEEIIEPQVSVPSVYDIGHIHVNVSAIVGKNGAGKSSLAELLYAVLYNISHKLNLIEKYDDDIEDNDSSLEEQPLIQYLKEQDVNVDIYYKIDKNYYRLRSNGNNLRLTQFNDSKKGFLSGRAINDIKYLKQLFYSVVINYSSYSLNTMDTGHWIKAIFHKNDSYQTPIVLNPYRRRGIIDINVENYLVRSRLLANILDGSGYALWSGNDGKTPERLVFKIDENKIKYKPEEKLRAELVINYNNYWIIADSIIRAVFFSGRIFKVGSEDSEEFAKKYILVKLESISRKYKRYLKYRDFLNSPELLERFFKSLKADESHVAYKIKQAINFLYLTTVPKKRTVFARSVNGLTTRLQKIRGEQSGVPLITLVPPSFFSVDIEFHNKQDKFNLLSSGEKQRLYALSSLIYHLKNINSVKETLNTNALDGQLIKYEHINIIFDEVELYYHPELQRRFLKDLFDNIRAANLEDISSINFLFVTHSPFILSDIPNSNILYLRPKQYKTEQVAQVNETFGGNIHDLLANSFFLEENGFIGEYARQVISSAFYYLLPDDNKPKEKPELRILWDQSMLRSMIDMVGEPLIKRSLNELYSDRYLQMPDEIDREIRRLQELKASKI
ncbi:AAA family ATPase [Mucilaginibacter pocheonensis]|uniref:ATPase n=1 Tax=Mucilaginibacter pocheonensis TaxID=398050 RepID=A0ABU1TDJ0_9SPHI|nr:AAA family ATPase [Mucilaginibacter pocheonensis]MDR6942930.1 putative ATPase [Mucilaginibacter pocheonensis]